MKFIKSLSCYFLFASLLIYQGCKDDDQINPANQTATPNDFLSDKNYTSLTIQIVYVEGFAPTASAVSNLKSLSVSSLNKPAGINVIQKKYIFSRRSSYPIADIKSIEEASRTAVNSDKMLTAFFFFADADYAANSGSLKTLGVAYGILP